MVTTPLQTGPRTGLLTLERPPGGALDWPRSPATTKRAQVRGILEHLIDTELHPGDPIPSERALVIRLGVSRVTVRQAITDLVDTGVLERVHGKGTYITGPAGRLAAAPDLLLPRDARTRPGPGHRGAGRE